MFVLHATVGAVLMMLNILTGSYLTYRLYKSKRTQNSCVPVIILLSETLVAFAIGLLNIFCYGCSQETNITAVNITELRQANQTMCETTTINCEYKEMIMEQIVLVVTAVHCFMSLITSSVLCSKHMNEKRAEEASTSIENKTRIPNPSTSSVIGAQWLLPLFTALCLYYTVKATDGKTLCEINTPQYIVSNFQTLVSELLDQPLNVTDKTVHETEIDNIIGKVYSIVESATEIGEVKKVPDLDEGFQIENILNKLHTTRAPKDLKTEMYLLTTSYKIFTLFILFGYIIPMIYANNTRMKLQMAIDVNKSKDLKDLNVYLKVLMISAASLWTPCIAEVFSRTYITQTHPDITMQILMTVGSSFMLVKNGMNLKLLNKVIGHENSVQPKA